MIDEKTVDLILERMTRRVDQANEYMLMKIGSSVKKIRKLSKSQARQLVQMLKYGGDYNDIVNKLSQYMNLNVKDVESIMREFAKKDTAFYEKFFRYRNIPFPSFEENNALKTYTEALSRTVRNEMYNFTRTNVLGYTIRDLKGRPQFFGLKETYNRVLEEALSNVGQGKESFDSAMTRILNEIGGSGLKTLDYESGRSVRLDSAVKMHLKSKLRELHNEAQQIVGEQFDSDGVEISVHDYPAPDHEAVQGRQFSTKRKRGQKLSEWQKLQSGKEATDYKGTTYTLDHDHKNGYRPISEMNCYHYTYSIILGVSEPRYSEKQLKDIRKANNKGFMYKGKKRTLYEGTQIQRNLERAIRTEKDKQILGRASGNEDLIIKSQANITRLTNKYRKFSKESGLPTRMQRARVRNYHRVKTNRQVNNMLNTSLDLKYNPSDNLKLAKNNRKTMVDQKYPYNVTNDKKLFEKIDREKQIYHSTNNLKEIFESDYLTGNLQVQNKGAKVVNYGYEGIMLKPQSLNYSVKLYNGDRGNVNTGDRAEKLVTTNMKQFIDKAGVDNKYSTAVVEDLPVLENVQAIATYKLSDNYEMLKKIAEQNNIPLVERQILYKPKIVKKKINQSNPKK